MSSAASRSPRLAADFSAAPSRANGGLIGPLRQDELAPAFQKVLEPMKVGDVTEPIRTTRGYQLLKLESRTETRVRGFADARNDIGERVADTKRQGELQKYLDRLRSQATVTWRNDELKRAYEQALAKRQSAAPGGRAGQGALTPPRTAMVPPVDASPAAARRPVVRHLDAVAARADRPRPAGTEGDRVVPADGLASGAGGRTGRRRIDWPLFPGYCFARFDVRARLDVLKCAGVVSIVSVDGEPAPIPERDIAGIRQLVESELAYDPVPADPRG